MHDLASTVPYRSSQHGITSKEQQEILGTIADNQFGVSWFPIAIVMLVIAWLGLIEIIFLFCRSLRWSQHPSNFNEEKALSTRVCKTEWFVKHDILKKNKKKSE